MKYPLVSVTILSYNQEKYIAQCLESALSQKTDFQVEIIIGDDGSTDGTKAIILQYAEKYPQIKFIDRPENIGLHKNFVDVIHKCSGTYIALLEGDDYWLHPGKLQMQADFLNEHTNCSACFTNCRTFWDGKIDEGEIKFGEKNKPHPPELFNLDEYFADYRIVIPNNTKMFRKSAMPDELPALFYTHIQWDYLIHLYNGLHGDFGYIPKVTLAYRRHDNTIISDKNLERILFDAMDLEYIIKTILPPRYWKYFNVPYWEMNTLAFHYLGHQQYGKYITWYLKWFRHTPWKNINIKDEFYKFRQCVKHTE